MHEALTGKLVGVSALIRKMVIKGSGEDQVARQWDNPSTALIASPARSALSDVLRPSCESVSASTHGRSEIGRGVKE